MSARRDIPRHMTMLPGGGSLPRASDFGQVEGEGSFPRQANGASGTIAGHGPTPAQLYGASRVGSLMPLIAQSGQPAAPRPYRAATLGGDRGSGNGLVRARGPAADATGSISAAILGPNSDPIYKSAMDQTLPMFENGNVPPRRLCQRRPSAARIPHRRRGRAADDRRPLTARPLRPPRRHHDPPSPIATVCASPSWSACAGTCSTWRRGTCTSSA